MSNYALIVSTPPTDNKTHTALAFAKQLICSGHRLLGVFFYQDGVINANAYVQTPTDEINPLLVWQSFAKQSEVALHLCVSAAERRGLTDSKELTVSPNIADGFIISGLGELVVLTNKADKVIQL